MQTSLKTYLKAALKCNLPGIEAHKKMLPPTRRLKSYDSESDLVILSSVLFLIFPEGNEYFTCLMKRPPTMKHHPGQIGFPGGKVETKDSSPEMAALREAYEELGIVPDNVEILGNLSNLFIDVSQFSILPVIGWSIAKPDFVLNYSEVEELIIFPLSKFVSNEIIAKTELETTTGLLEVNYYPFGGEIIWGATAMIISEMIEILKRY